VVNGISRTPVRERGSKSRAPIKNDVTLVG